MRITTQMLNRSAREAGIPANRTSLLNYIKGSGSKVSLADTLSGTKTADVTRKSGYDKLEKSADQAAASADRLAAAEGENVTAADLRNFVENYNGMLKNLGGSSDTLNLFYGQTAKDTVKEHQQELAQIGITAAKDGTLQFDGAKFEKSGAGQSALFGEEGGFFSRIGFLAARVSDFAGANAKSFSGYYNAAGSRANMYSDGRYNFWS